MTPIHAALGSLILRVHTLHGSSDTPSLRLLDEIRDTWLFSGRVDSPLMFSNPIYKQQKAQLLVELVSWIAWEEIILSE